MTIVTRFAPSPSGHLHLGNLYSALFAARTAKLLGGSMKLRIEDIDSQRSRPEYEEGILNDLRRIGVDWSGKVIVQSGRMELYKAALAELEARGLLYPCFCSRHERLGFLNAPHGSPEIKCPNDCKNISSEEASKRRATKEPYALRLNISKAAEELPILSFLDLVQGRRKVELDACTDVMLGLRDMPVGYHIACVVDDALQEVSLVTRGEDLLESAPVQRILQSLLGLPETTYLHHPLVRGSDGKRLSKRDGSLCLDALLAEGNTIQCLLNDFEEWFSTIFWKKPKEWNVGGSTD